MQTVISTIIILFLNRTMLRAALYKKRVENPIFKNNPFIGSFQYINSFSWAHYPYAMTQQYFSSKNPYIGTFDHSAAKQDTRQKKERHEADLAEIILIELHDIKDDWISVEKIR